MGKREENGVQGGGRVREYGEEGVDIQWRARAQGTQIHRVHPG